MALAGDIAEVKIWNYFAQKGLSPYGVAGLMGNLFAESGLNSKNLQNSCEKRLGMTDDEYTNAVDSGKYTNFGHDSAGYGLAQWTYYTRKELLLFTAKDKGVSIGDLQMQLDFLWMELSGKYKGVLSGLKTANSVREASDVVLTQFEKPKDQSEATKQKRAAFGQEFYNKYGRGKNAMAITIGSARIDERGKLSGGAAGDQKQTGASDYKGEVSMQPFYVHTKGWVVIRAKSAVYAMRIAANMITACNNRNIGYDQGNRTGIIKYGVNTITPTECDCSSLVRECVIEATGKDPGNFTTANEASALMATGLFDRIDYKSGTMLFVGDILVTKTQGHTVVVVDGMARIQEQPQAPATPPNYEDGKSYTLYADLSVRSGSGSEYYIYKYDELPLALHKKDANKDGKLDKGTQVKCHASKKLKNGNIWVRVLEHDYWIIAYNKQKGSVNLA